MTLDTDTTQFDGWGNEQLFRTTFVEVS